MATEQTHWTLGTLVLTLSGLLAESVRRLLKKDEENHKVQPPTVRQWYQQEEEILQGFRQAKEGWERVERTLAEVNLPEMKRMIALQSAEITGIKTEMIGMRNQLDSVRNESGNNCERMDERMDSLTRRIDKLSE